MKPKGSLSYSHDPTPGICPEPDASIQYAPNISWRSIIILSSPLRQRLSSGPFPSDIHTKILYAFLISCRLFHTSGNQINKEGRIY
jgi:hypothetical protein